jgi:delta-aminolevulinic acid dehydratase/porphobilinogen synthase
VKLDRGGFDAAEGADKLMVKLRSAFIWISSAGSRITHLLLPRTRYLGNTPCLGGLRKRAVAWLSDVVLRLFRASSAGKADVILTYHAKQAAQ